MLNKLARPICFGFFITLFLLLPKDVLAGGLPSPQNVRVESIDCGTPPKAYAYFSWDKVSNAEAYRFYARTEESEYTSYDETKTNSYKLGFNPEFNFYITVSSIIYPDPNVIGDILAESKGQEEYFLSAGKLCKVEQPKPVTKPKGVLELTHQDAKDKTSEDLMQKDQSKQLEEATAKIAALEKQAQAQEEKSQALEKNLQETQERQSVLEKIVQRILSFLHSFGL